MLAKFLPIGLFLLLLACTAAVPASSPAGPASAPSGVVVEAPSPVQPILTEEQALQVALRRTGMSGPGVTSGSGLGNAQARLMTLEEYEERFDSGRSYGDRSIPVWVVTVEGTWSPARLRGRLHMTQMGQPTATPTVYTQGIEVMDARSGKAIGGQKRITPLHLDAAQGLDPESLNTYPLRVSLSGAQEFAVFPVSQPGYLPEEYSLTDIRLALSNPVQDLLHAFWVPNQTVIKEYADGQDHILLFAQSNGGLRPDTIRSFRPTAVHSNAAWESDVAGGPTWLAWRARLTGVEPLGSHNVTHTLYSPTDSISLETLHLIAESLPPGEAPIPTPTPIIRPPAAAMPAIAPTTTPPTVAPISTPVPTPASSGLGSLSKVPTSSLIGRLGDGTGLTLTFDDGKVYNLEAECSQVEAALETNAGLEVGLLVEGEVVFVDKPLRVLSVNNGGISIPTCANESGGPLVPPAPPPTVLMTPSFPGIPPIEVRAPSIDCRNYRPIPLDLPVEIEGPSELRGEICGLGADEQLVLRLRPVLADDDYGDPVLSFTSANGNWEHTGLVIEPGRYILDVETDDTSYITIPRMFRIVVPDKGIAWIAGNLRFEFVDKDNVVERFGYPICKSKSDSAGPSPTPVPPPPPSGPSGVPTCAALPDGVIGSGEPQIDGRLSGLGDEDVANVNVYRLPRVEGRCYGTYDQPEPDCIPGLGPEALDQVPDLSQAESLARFSSEGPLWGLRWKELQVGRFLVVVEAPGYEVTPAAYAIDMLFHHLVPSRRLSGLDFTLELE